MADPPLLGYYNIGALASLAGGSWQSSWPLANMKDIEIAKVSRSTDASTGSTYVTFDLGAAWPIRFMGFHGHNLGASATHRWRAAATAMNVTGSPAFDSGAVNVWLGTNTPTLQSMYTPSALHIASADQAYRYWRLDISDTGNADGYVEIGYVMLWVAMELGPGIQSDASLQPETGTVEVQTIGLVSKYDRRPSTLVYRFTVDHIEFADADRLLDAVLARDIDEPLYIIPFPDDSDPGRHLRRSFLCRSRTLPGISQPWWDREKASFELVKIVA